MSIWGQSNQPKSAVAMTEANAAALADMIIKGLVEASRDDLIAQYRKIVQTEADLAQERALTARLRADNDALRQHIINLQSILATMNPAPSGQVYASSNNGGWNPPTTQLVPTFDQRLASSIPVPPWTDPSPAPAS